MPLAPFRARGDVRRSPRSWRFRCPRPTATSARSSSWKIEDVAARRGRGVRSHWLVNESGWTGDRARAPGERVRSSRDTSASCSAASSSFRRRHAALRRALEARRLPHLLVGGSSFHEREEVEAMRNALAAIERPDDELAVFATLRGPLLAISDAGAARTGASGSRPASVPAPPDRPARRRCTRSRDALALLRDLHRGRNRRPVADTIARLLEATRAHAGTRDLAHRRAGARQRRPADGSRARAPSSSGLVSFRALRRPARGRGRARRRRRGAAARGRRRGRAHHDRAQGQGARVPDRDARRHDRQRDAASSRCAGPMPRSGSARQRLAGCTPPELREHGAEEMEREREEACACSTSRRRAPATSWSSR